MLCVERRDAFAPVNAPDAVSGAQPSGPTRKTQIGAARSAVRPGPKHLVRALTTDAVRTDTSERIDQTGRPTHVATAMLRGVVRPGTEPRANAETVTAPTNAVTARADLTITPSR